MFTVVYGTAMPTQPGDVYHGQQIPTGYTRVGVEQVRQGWDMLELDIPRGDGERTLAEAIHGYILWDKHYIVLNRMINHQDRHVSMPLLGRHLRKTP